MNLDQARGTFKDYVGRAQAGAGRLLGSDQLQTRGLQFQVLGRADKRLNEVRMAIKAADAAIRKAQS